MNKGFTLMELLVVIVIIVILASIVWVSLAGMREEALDARIHTNLSQLRNVAEQAADPLYDNICRNGIHYSAAFLEMTAEGSDHPVDDEDRREMDIGAGDLSYAEAECNDDYNNWCVQAYTSATDDDGNRVSLCVDRTRIHGDKDDGISYICTDSGRCEEN